MMQTKPVYRQQLFRVSEKQRWLTFIFPGLFIADILYGGMDFYGLHAPVSPGVVLRGSLFLLAVIMILKYHHLVGRDVFYWVLATVTLALPGIITGALAENLVRDIYYLLRVLYGPVLVLLVTILIQKYRIEVKDVLRFIEYAAYVLGLSLLISQQLGIQRETYGDYAFGNTGIFYAQNDLTLAFGLSLLAASYRLVDSFSLKRLVLTGLSMFACLQIGTRASLVVVLGCASLTVALAVWARLLEEHGKRSFRRVTRLIFSIVVAAGIVGLFIYGLSLHSQTSYQQQKLEQLAQGELPRSVLITAALNHLDRRAPFLNLTGEGMTSFMRGVARYFPTPKGIKLVEVDWMDFYGAYGILFTGVIYSFFLVVFFGSCRYFLRSSRNLVYGVIAAASGMYIGHSVLAGHALASPIPTTLIAGYAGVYLSLNKKGRGKLLYGPA